MLLDAAADRRVRALVDDLVRGHRDGLQARGAEAVDGGAGDARPAGRPGSRRRARRCCPASRCGWPQPRMTSSISVGSSCGALPSTSLMQWAARSSGRVRLNDPRNDLASGVRELATMTASLMGTPFSGGEAVGSIPQRWTEGTHAVVRPPTVSWRMCSPRTVVAGGPPRRWPQRRWKSHQRGIAVAVRAGAHRDRRSPTRSWRAAGRPPRRRGCWPRGAGRDARLVEHLVRDPVADAGREGLVEQHRLDRRSRPCSIAWKRAGVGSACQASKPSVLIGGSVGGSSAQPDAAEPPAVGQGRARRRPRSARWSLVKRGGQSGRRRCRRTAPRRGERAARRAAPPTSGAEMNAAGHARSAGMATAAGPARATGACRGAAPPSRGGRQGAPDAVGGTPSNTIGSRRHGPRRCAGPWRLSRRAAGGLDLGELGIARGD